MSEADTRARPGQDLYARLHTLSKSLESSGRIDEHDNPDAYRTVLDAMIFVAQAAQPAPNTLDPAAHAPVARITVAENGFMTSAALLHEKPTLPAGAHDLWCAPVGSAVAAVYEACAQLAEEHDNRDGNSADCQGCGEYIAQRIREAAPKAAT